MFVSYSLSVIVELYVHVCVHMCVFMGEFDTCMFAQSAYLKNSKSTYEYCI